MALRGIASARPVERADEQRARGKAARAAIPFESLGTFLPIERSAAAILAAQESDRLAHLRPLRRERMSASPFTFYRGSAAVMAHDLAGQDHTETHLVVCGDAHLSNFGLFASPERQLMFDLNDFDEAAPGPWEWDVKRLVTSVVLAAEENGLSDRAIRTAAVLTAETCRTGLRRLLGSSHLDRYYASTSLERMSGLLPEALRPALEKAVVKARKRTSARAIERFMSVDKQGRDRFVESPPILTHVPHLTEETIQRLFDEYRLSVRPDIALLLGQYALTDVALRVVGVGSVGTRCYLLALTGSDGSHLLLQIKQADASVVAQNCHPHPGAPTLVADGGDQGRRVVACQEILQSASDPFLSHVANEGRHFYVRQFRDMKGSIDVSRLRADELTAYGEVCAAILARAHAQSPAAPWVGGYLGKSGGADEAFAAWSVAYAAQVHRDYEAYVATPPAGAGGPGTR